jgi:hypothetical protein
MNTSAQDKANLPPAIADALKHELAEAEHKAWDSLSRYKFQMFGYWAAIWVHLNRIGNFRRPNPWKSIVTAAREKAA